MTLVVAVTGVPLAIRLVVAASSCSWFAGPAAALGRRTLPVYVMHVPVLSLLHELAQYRCCRRCPARQARSSWPSTRWWRPQR